MPKKPAVLRSMPVVEPSKDGLSVNFTFEDTMGRRHSFVVHPVALTEIIGRWMMASRQASERYTAAPGNRTVALAFPVEGWATGHSPERKSVLLTLDVARGGRLEFELSAGQADLLSSSLAASSSKVKPPSPGKPH